MSVQRLQKKIQEKKTPLALGLAAKMHVSETEKTGEMLYREGLQVLDAAAERLPAVYLCAATYLRCGVEGFAALCRLADAARDRGLYVIVDCHAGDSMAWLQGIPGADAVTVTPYLGGDSCKTPEGKTVFAAVRTAGVHSCDVQNLVAGDRRLYQAAAEQMVYQGAGLVIETGYLLDIRDLRRRFEKAFLIVTHADAEAASYAFDDYGHGALVVDDAIQYAPDPAYAAQQAVKAMKEWVTVF